MDFPIDLNTGKFITGVDEFKQTFELIFKNQLGTFMQASNLGSHVAIHSSDADFIRLNVEDTIAEIPGVTIKSMKLNLPEVNLEVEYRDELINFTFSVE